MTAFFDIINATWLIVFFISIFFVFLIIFRDLGSFTQKLPHWERASYYKKVPLFSLITQHFSRKGELLANTKYNLCKIIQKDLLHFLALKKGFSQEDMDKLVANREALLQIFTDENLVDFLYDTTLWLEKMQIDKSFSSRIVSFLKGLFKEEDDYSSIIYGELAIILSTFRKHLESSSKT